jgi:RsiW-degrading membrane proteinase PrsW (M82 family)
MPRLGMNKHYLITALTSAQLHFLWSSPIQMRDLISAQIQVISFFITTIDASWLLEHALGCQLI